MKTISNSQISIKVSPLGAELCSIFANGKEYLWQADPAFWKRHSPVLFPIVGSLWENEYRIEGTAYTLTQHGFARDMTFTLISEEADELRYRLISNTETLAKYPYPFCLEIGYRLHNKQIEVMWEVKNTGEKEMFFQIGAHPAFYWPDFEETTQERGYFGFDKKDNFKYILISEKGCADPSTEYTMALSDELLPLDTHTFDKDALIIENSQIKTVTLYNRKKKACLSLHFTAPVVGLWSPPEKNAPFICIEPWYGRCDWAHYTGEYKDKDWMQHLQAGETFKGGYTIEINE
ncbi:aldose 1-epimerase family protein [Bacteroides sp.]|uniref:aldose 1-epimerase family protein n=1 Tax=Bacteroides sp. TaxID=29523 RepID=UPI0026383B4B|nr:aldose 1-epimerase family protein [Bacteroides sp.]MDD3039204.1 aldose 1-epimerase family protein [Bacteroides sp.]